MMGDDAAEFKPSAAGINPMTGKLFIVASSPIIFWISLI
jgi:hypothetical protein